MASNSNGYGYFGNIVNGMGNQHSASNGYFSNTSPPFNEDFGSTRQAQTPGQAYGIFPMHPTFDNRSVSGLIMMIPHSRSTQQDQPFSHHRGTIPSHPASNMRSTSGPSVILPRTGGHQHKVVSGASTAGRDGYGSTPAEMGYGMPNMIAVNCQQSVGAGGFSQSGGTPFGSKSFGRSFTAHGGMTVLSGFGSTAIPGNTSNHNLPDYEPYHPHTSMAPESWGMNTGYRPSSTFFHSDNGHTSPRYISGSYNGPPTSYPRNNDEGRYQPVQAPFREYIQPLEYRSPYTNTQHPRSVAHHPPGTIAQPTSNGQNNSPGNISDYGSVRRSPSYLKNLTFEPNMYNQHAGDSLASATPRISDDNVGFIGLSYPLPQPQSATPLDLPSYTSRTPALALVLTNEEQAQSEVDAYESSEEEDNSNVPRRRTILLAQLCPRDFISEWPKGSANFYVFRCPKCSAKGFEKAGYAWQHFSRHRAYAGVEAAGNKGVDACGLLVIDVTPQAGADTFNKCKKESKTFKNNWREGFDKFGYDEDGFDRHGFDRDGFSKDGNPPK